MSKEGSKAPEIQGVEQLFNPVFLQALAQTLADFQAAEASPAEVVQVPVSLREAPQKMAQSREKKGKPPKNPKKKITLKCEDNYPIARVVQIGMALHGDDLYDDDPELKYIHKREGSQRMERGYKFRVTEEMAAVLLTFRTLSIEEGMTDQYVPTFTRG